MAARRALTKTRPRFRLMHAKCGARTRQQTFCPDCQEVIDRAELVLGHEFAPGCFVRVTHEELRALRDYHQLVRELIDAKVGALAADAPTSRMARANPEKVVDLVDALKRQIASGPRPRRSRRRSGVDEGA